MKRKYIKPYLLIEPYQLDAECAACSSDGYIPIHYSEKTCTAWGRFFGDTEICEVDLVTGSDEAGDGFCYHGPFVAGVTFVYS